jgi:hypothetical protein
MQYLKQALLAMMALGAFCAAALGADAGGEMAKVDVTCVVPKAVASFAGTLELRLYKIHPLLMDAPADLVEKVEVKDFSHTQGTETKKELVIGAKAKLDPTLKYYVTCFVLGPNGQRTHMGEPGDKRFLCEVLTLGNSKLATFKVRKV